MIMEKESKKDDEVEENRNCSKELDEQEISRRKFLRKSAEVAALSLFGVLGFDAVANKVLEQIAENRAAGKLSDAAAKALKENRLDYYAEASEVRPAFCWWPWYICRTHNWACEKNPKVCDDEFVCDRIVYNCGNFNCVDNECMRNHKCDKNDCRKNDCGGGGNTAKYDCTKHNLPCNSYVCRPTHNCSPSYVCLAAYGEA